MYNSVERMASAVRNNLVSGLRGFHQNMSLSDELLCDSVVNERLQVLKEYSLKGILPLKDLYVSINCIEVDCKDIDRCMCGYDDECSSRPQAHFEIPQLLNDYGVQAIEYMGATDMQLPFIVYTSPRSFRYRKYRKRGKDRPWVWVDVTPNENGMNDCFVFNAPLLDHVTVVGIFKDLRQLGAYSCCQESQDSNFSFIDNEIIKRLTEKLILYYRQLAAATLQNDQQYAQG